MINHQITMSYLHLFLLLMTPIHSMYFSEGQKPNLSVSTLIKTRTYQLTMASFSVRGPVGGWWQRFTVTQVRVSYQQHPVLTFSSTFSALDAGIRIRPNAEDLLEMPEFETRWKTYFANSPDKPIMWLGTLAS